MGRKNNNTRKNNFNIPTPRLSSEQQQRHQQANLFVGQPRSTLRENVNADTLLAKVSFSKFDSSFECISSWPNSDTKQLLECLRKLCNTAWKDIKATGGKGGSKNGLGYTTIHGSTFRKTYPAWLSKDIPITEIRVCKKKRLFGIRNESTFYLIWLDKNHSIAP